ncbi:tetratricopeptide repeat protein [Ramlibacter albus]|uniref:Tetratricopeptide repeat protein n=1 Tax=Ramlibacter albus TaxID=2079448 RepID=A0A923S418_9BURK|nr:tetratricopeptide repeat protein [Ramlibacter albus]MBC5763657.1 tetratricopeptide repeat protein [Ramlibacter albus]
MLASIFKFLKRPAAPTDWRERGNAALAAGDYEAAAACYLEGTQPEPGDPVAWLNLAFAQLELGRHDAARESLRRAEGLLPAGDASLPEVWFLQARERHEQRDWAAAAAAYRRVVDHVPAHAFAWRELGQATEMQGDLAGAEACYRKAVAAQPDLDVALRDRARVLLAMRRDADALAAIESLLRRNPAELATPANLPHASPRDPDVHLMHAEALLRLGRASDALAVCDRSLAAAPHVPTLNMRGVILRGLGRPEEALACHAQALEQDPTYASAWLDIARAQERLGRNEDALASVDSAVAAGCSRREAVLVRSGVLMAQLRCREAVELLERDLSAQERADPEVDFFVSFLYLLLGDYARGWPGYEARWQLTAFGVANRKPDFGAPEWRGEPLQGRTIVLYAEQGLGDSIQSLRFVRPVAERAGRVKLRIQRALVPVLGPLPENCELVAENSFPRVDFACPLMSLPVVLGTTIDTIPNEVPYLAAPPQLVEKWRAKLGERRGALRVGVAWSGNPMQANDHNRSMPLAALRDAARGDIEFVSLQKEVRASDEAVLREWPALRHFGAELESFGDTAAIASLVDVVISVDTSVAHLCGALGRPLSVVLTHCADWRWLLGRDDSPWYPTAKLYRQERRGDWSVPVARAMAELEARAALRSPASA